MSLPLKKDEEFIQEKLVKERLQKRRMNLSQEKLTLFKDIRFKKQEVYVNYNK